VDETALHSATFVKKSSQPGMQAGVRRLAGRTAQIAAVLLCLVKSLNTVPIRSEFLAAQKVT
jgi:hypothetical protein